MLLLEVFSDCNSFLRVATKRGRAQVPECVSWRNGWDLRRWDHQRKLVALIRKLGPDFLILALPCTVGARSRISTTTSRSCGSPVGVLEVKPLWSSLLSASLESKCVQVAAS